MSHLTEGSPDYIATSHKGALEVFCLLFYAVLTLCDCGDPEDMSCSKYDRYIINKQWDDNCSHVLIVPALFPHSLSSQVRAEDTTVAEQGRVFTPPRRKSEVSDLLSVLAAFPTLNAAGSASTSRSFIAQKDSSRLFARKQVIFSCVCAVFLWYQTVTH